MGPQQRMRMAPSRFAEKCPNRAALLDFFANHMQRYTPPARYMTATFGRDILSGRKKLLKKAEVRWVQDLPNWKEFSATRIWQSCRNRAEWAEIQQYFPSGEIESLPNKQYLVNILNTAIPNCIIETIKAIRQQRIVAEENEQPIVMTHEYYQAL